MTGEDRETLGRDANLTAGAGSLLIQFAGAESVWVAFAHIHSITAGPPLEEEPELAGFGVQTASEFYYGFAPAAEIRAVVRVWERSLIPAGPFGVEHR